MSSTNKTSLGLNLWEASDKPVRQDFVNDNTIIDEKITNIKSSLDNVNSNLDNVNSNLSEKLALTTFNMHKTSGDHDGRYYTESEVDAKFNSLTKVISTSYTGNGSGRRTIPINFNVYNLIIKPQNSINIFGGDGGNGGYTVTEECNQSGVIYFVILFGVAK